MLNDDYTPPAALIKQTKKQKVVGRKKCQKSMCFCTWTWYHDTLIENRF